MKNFLHISNLLQERIQSGKRYYEFLRIPIMSSGLYVLKAGEKDLQSPHREDELYYVIHGRARMKVGDEDQAVTTGSVIFVAATVEHHFYDVQEDLTVLVFFAPAETE